MESLLVGLIGFQFLSFSPPETKYKIQNPNYSTGCLSNSAQRQGLKRLDSSLRRVGYEFKSQNIFNLITLKFKHRLYSPGF